MPQINETVLEIDLKALEHNLNYLRSLIRPETKLLAVVKAYAYGSDPVIIAKHLEKLKVDYFAVAYVNEGVTLRDAGIKTPILVLHPQIGDFQKLVDHRLEPALYSHRILDFFTDFATVEKLHHYPVHLKFNTGLNRLGFNAYDLPVLLDTLKKCNAIKIVSAFSHLVASEDPDERQLSLNQIAAFRDIARQLIDGLTYKPLLHMLNTSGIMNYPEAQFDMVRAGISLYGFANDEQFTKHLKNVVSLKSVISQIHTVKKGDSVGYNRGFVAAEDLRSATIPIGHADGIQRALGKGKGFVTVHGLRAPILGNVCMDMLMVDVTNIPCEEGDQVIIFDDQQTINELANSIQSIPYEILTAISQRVKRIVK